MSGICPQCKEEIQFTLGHPDHPYFDANEKFCVGWCRLEMHVRCFALHLRTCRPCMAHNLHMVSVEKR